MHVWDRFVKYNTRQFEVVAGAEVALRIHKQSEGGEQPGGGSTSPWRCGYEQASSRATLATRGAEHRYNKSRRSGEEARGGDVAARRDAASSVSSAVGTEDDRCVAEPARLGHQVCIGGGEATGGEGVVVAVER
ncbi:hypothetical protein BHM03_00044275 [Ensete ventricosum]|nr:hypothetical protein BHM03_00044275 [Ensete ventricosum]